MALTETTGLTANARLDAIESALKGDAVVCLDLPNCVYFVTAAGAPSNGVTGANAYGPGSIYVNISTGKAYINTNTKASPTWTVIGAQTA